MEFDLELGKIGEEYFWSGLKLSGQEIFLSYFSDDNASRGSGKVPSYTHSDIAECQLSS